MKSEIIKRYCEENKLFTRGTGLQFRALLNNADKGFPLSDIATSIWFFSRTTKTADVIEQELSRRLGGEKKQRRKERNIAVKQTTYFMIMMTAFAAMIYAVPAIAESSLLFSILFAIACLAAMLKCFFKGRLWRVEK